MNTPTLAFRLSQYCSFSIIIPLSFQVGAVMGRALVLEECRAGASNVLLDDCDVACYMDMFKEKLSGQVVAGFLEEKWLRPVRITLRHLNRLLGSSTREEERDSTNDFNLVCDFICAWAAWAKN
jgi:hypothetical protein